MVLCQALKVDSERGKNASITCRAWVCCVVHETRLKTSYITRRLIIVPKSITKLGHSQFPRSKLQNIRPEVHIFPSPAIPLLSYSVAELTASPPWHLLVPHVTTAYGGIESRNRRAANELADQFRYLCSGD